MNPKKIVKDLAAAFGAQGVSFLCSCLTVLFLPKVLGVESFGYWQLFVFYAGYVSFFQLGLNDGVYLNHGGESRHSIDKGLIKGELAIGLGYQVFFAIGIMAFSFAEGGSERSFVLFSAAVYLLLSNVWNYLAYVFQAMNETRLFSMEIALNRASFLVALLPCLVFGIGDFRVYVCLYLAAQGIALCHAFWHARDILRVPFASVGPCVRALIRDMRYGIVLTFANVASMLMLGMARFAIDFVWGIEEFSEVSLSLSLVNFALVFVSQFAMVLFPSLRSVDAQEERRWHCALRDGLSVILPAVFLLYAPLRFVIGFWLPEYESGLSYLIFLFPVCVFEMQTNLVVATFLKVRNQPGVLLLLNAVAVGVSAASVALVLFLHPTPMAVVAASLSGVAARFALGTGYLTKLYGDSNVKAAVAVVGSCVAFVVGAWVLPPAGSFVLSVLVFAIVVIACRKERAELVSSFARLVEKVG